MTKIGDEYDTDKMWIAGNCACKSNFALLTERVHWQAEAVELQAGQPEKG